MLTSVPSGGQFCNTVSAFSETPRSAHRSLTVTSSMFSCSKNRMDRYTILSKRNLDLLTRYWFECGRPRGILFPNRWTGDYLTVSTLEQVMRRAVAQADISVKATPHSLRHSFATHLMEQGTDQKLIQSLLGHRDPKSTEVYLHVSNKSLMDVESPFDRKEGDQND